MRARRSRVLILEIYIDEKTRRFFGRDARVYNIVYVDYALMLYRPRDHNYTRRYQVKISIELSFSGKFGVAGRETVIL